MSRIRTVKPEFWQHPKTGAVSRDARLLFLGLLNEADDEGRMRYSPKRLAGVLFPFDEDVDSVLLDSLVLELEDVGSVARYQVDGGLYLEIPGFTEHQRINRKTDSTLPVNPHDALTEPSLNPHDALTEVVHREVEVEVEVEREWEQGKELAPLAPKRDYLWEALLSACGIDNAITNGARGGYNKALKELRDAGATPEDICTRARNHRTMWPQASLTPHSLAKHWAELRTLPAPADPVMAQIQRQRELEGRA